MIQQILNGIIAILLFILLVTPFLFFVAISKEGVIVGSLCATCGGLMAISAAQGKIFELW